jgi:phage shock protein A
MTQKTKHAGDVPEQTIEQLQERYQALHTRKIQSETHLQNARQQLETLKRQAREAYGTDDVAELAKKLESMKAENEQKRQGYEADLDRIEAELSAVEQKFSAAENSSNPEAGT